MAISIDLYKNSSPVEKLGKTLSSKTTVSNVRLKQDTSILRPVLIISTSTDVYSYNYMEIPTFNRFYFIDDVRSINDGIWEISAHVDVLETYKDQIKANTAVIRRQQNLFNLYLDDPEAVVYSTEQILTKKFTKTGFNKSLFYLLTVNGGGGE